MRRSAGSAIGSLNARAGEDGHLTLNEPNDLPEGTVVPLEIADGWDDLDEEERKQLHQALDEAIASVQAGRTVDGTK